MRKFIGPDRRLRTVVRAFLILLSVFLFIIAALSLARAAQTDGARDSGLLLPPPSAGKPIVVTVALHVINLAMIDEVHQRFDLNGYLIVGWNDPRLAFNPSGPDDNSVTYHVGEVWHPSIEIVNAVIPRERFDRSLTVQPSGAAHYVERFHAHLSSRFHLRKFPFDTQLLEIVIHPFFGEMHLETFAMNKIQTWTASHFDSYSSLASWHLGKLAMFLGSAPVYDGSQISEVRFQIPVQRRYAFYLWKVFLPLLLMVVLSWAIFWLEPMDLDNQIQVGVTTILTVIAFGFAISSNLPAVPYLTFIDAFFLTCYVFVFTAVLELMTVHVIHRKRREIIGYRIRRLSRWIIPVAFVITNMIIIGVFLEGM